VRFPKLVVVAVGCVALSGCGLLNILRPPPLPPRELYRLRLSDTVSAVPVTGTAAAGLLPGSLAITRYETPGLYGESGIVYRVNSSAYGAYPSKEWALPLSEMLGSMTEAVFARRPISRDQAVYDPPSRNSHTYVWIATVREFEEVNVDQQVSVSVRLDAKIVRAADDSLIWSGNARVDAPVAAPTDRMENVVAALSDAALAVISKLGQQVTAEVHASSSTAATARP
jgi:ABC-type uncharacterized transport system auxiliary subunit